MNQYNISNDFVEIVAGTANQSHPAYMEATNVIAKFGRHNGEKEKAAGSAIMKTAEEMTKSIETLSKSAKTRDPRITESRGNLKSFKGCDNIQTVLGCLNTKRGGATATSMIRNLDEMRKAIETYAPQYVEGYEKNVELVKMEYENAVYLLVTGLTMCMTTFYDVEFGAKGIELKTRDTKDIGCIRKTITDFTKQLKSNAHREYLDAVIKYTIQKPVDTSVEPKTESAYMEASAADIITLIDAIVSNIGKIGSYSISIIRGIKNSVFGILPLIRTVLYLRYKKKADTILALEQQAEFLQQHIDQMKNRTNMDPKQKEAIIRKQQAHVEAYKKKAEKLRAQLVETEKEVATEIQKNPTTPSTDSGSSDDDFVLESYFTERTRSLKNKGTWNPDRIDKERQEVSLRKVSRGGTKGAKDTPLSPEMKKKLDALIKDLRKNTERDSLRIQLSDKKTEDSKPADRFRSKFGGTPYWPADKDWPTYKNKPMYMIAQINFGDMPKLDGYPNTGILQFFIPDSESWIDNDYLKGLVTKVVYHEKADKSVKQLDPIPISSIGLDPSSWDLPFDGMFFIDKFIPEKVCVQIELNAFNEAIEPLMKKYFGEDAHWTWNFEGWEYIYNAIKSWGHRFGGWPNFVQNDMMSDKYNRLLLQIDTDKHIMWGDCGVGNWFISDKALSQKNFDDVYFTWDCG